MNVGDKAPEILGIDQDGKEIRLSDYKGKKIVLYFYPKDLTSGCTAQACNLRDNYDALKAKGYAVIGASIQDEKSHRKFIEKNSLPFPLIADTDLKLVEAFGVYGEKKMYGRTYMGTFLHHQRRRHRRAHPRPETDQDQGPCGTDSCRGGIGGRADGSPPAYQKKGEENRAGRPSGTVADRPCPPPSAPCRQTPGAFILAGIPARYGKRKSRPHTR